MINILKTTFLLTALTLLLLFFGQAVAGSNGMKVAFVVACVMNFAAYWFSDKMVLAIYRAQPLSETESPEIYSIVRDLCLKTKLPMPRIYLIPSAAPNAFATGRNPKHAVVAVTQGIIELLSREELKGVLAHELAHVANRDILISSVAATLAGAIAMLAHGLRWSLYFGGPRRSGDRGGAHPLVLLAMTFLMPLAATLIQLAVSRSREFHADESGAHFSGDPLYLASALRKIEAASKRIPLQGAEPQTAHLFIMNPLSGGGFLKLFSTHPPVEERISRLMKLTRIS